MSDIGITAFIFISCGIGAEQDLLRRLNEIESVSETYILYGFYDLLVVLNAKPSDKIKEIVQSKIRKFKNVSSTVTMITTDEQF